MIINIEDEKSWPKEVTDLLASNLPTLAANAGREIAYCHASWDEKRRFSNEFLGKRSYVINNITDTLEGFNVIAYHCTRLLDDEISEILANGMEQPGLTLLEKRLKQAHEAGFLSLKQVDSVLTSNEYRNLPTREGVIHFTCSTLALKDEDGVGKFFRCWGGEAVFNTYQWYDLCPMTDLSSGEYPVERLKIYIDEETVRYLVCDFNSSRHKLYEGILENLDLNELSSKINNLDFYRQVLDITSKAGHTLERWKDGVDRTGTWPTLSSMGTPCIIKVSLSPDETDDLAVRLESTYLNNRQINTPNPAGFDKFISFPLPKEQVIKIIRYDDPEFTELTDHLNWRWPIRV